MANTQKFQAIIEVNSSKAHAEVERLRKEQKAAMDEIIKLKAKDSGATKEQIKAAEQKLKVVTDTLKKEEKHIKGLSAAMDNLSKKNYKELQQEVRTLTRLMRDGTVTKNSAEWKALAQRIKEAKREMNTYTEATVQSKNMFSRFFKFLNDSWGGVLILFQSITGISQTIRNSVSDFAKMEEAMADTRKYTGLSEEAVKDLNEELKKMDTRTAREELNELAGAAGRLGKTSKKEILEFVNAGDMIKVALGDDLGEGAIDNIGKLAMAFGEDEKMGLRGAMLATGSAVNELAQNSSAQAGYLVDFTARVAGFGKQLGLTQAQIMGFGAVMDENLLRDEMAATAFGNMLTKMQTDTAKFAKIAGMDVQKFTKLMKEDANGAVLALADSLKKADGQTMMNMLDDMGLDGSRAVGVLATLADKIDDVRARQQLATQAYKEATSVQNEFNVMNNTAQAELDKAKNRFHELSVELGERLKPVVTYTISAGGMLVKVLNTIADFLSANGKTVLRVATEVAVLTAAWNIQIVKVKVLTALTMAKTAVDKAAIAVEKGLAAAQLFTRNVLLSVQLAWILVTKGVQAYTVALRAARMASLTNPWTALATVLLTVGVAVYELSSRFTDEAKEAKKAKEATNEFVRQQQLMQSVNEEANRSIAEELARFNQLRKTLEDNKASLDERKKALAEIKKIAPEYHGQLTTENRLINSNTAALDGYINNLKRAALARAAFNKMVAIQENTLGHEQLLEGRKSNQQWVQKQLESKLGKGNQLRYNAYGGTYSIVDSEGKNVKAVSREEGKQIENLKKLHEYNERRIGEEKQVLTLNQKNTEYLEKQIQLNGGYESGNAGNTGGGSGGSGGGSSYTSDSGKKGKKTGKKTGSTTNKVETERKKKMRKELEDQKALNDSLIAMEMDRYNRGEQTYREYIENRHQKTIEGYDALIAIYKKYGESGKQLEDERAKAVMAKEDEMNKFSLSDLERRYQMQKVLIEQQYYDEKSAAYQNEQMINEELYEAEIEYLDKKAKLQRQGSEERAATEQEILLKEEQHKLEQAERYARMLEEYQEQWLHLGNEKQMKIVLDGLEELYSKQLLSEEEYQKAKLAIQARYAKNPTTQHNEQFDANVNNAIDAARAAAGDGYDKTQKLSLTNNPIVGRITQYRDMMAEIKRMEQEGVLSHAEAEQAKRETTAEMLKDMVSATQAAFDSVNQVMGAASSYYAAQSQYEQNVTAAKYDKEIEKAGNNQAKRKKLEEKKEKELAKIKNKYNKKQMKIELAQAVAQTAMGAINAYSSAAAIPLIGFTIAPIAAAMAVAAGLMQIAAIKKQHAAEQAGYYEGGFTGGKRYRKEAGVVHEGEFVVNHDGVNNRNLMPVLDLIDRAQRNNTIGKLTADDVTRRLGYDAAVVTPIVNVQNDNEDLRQSLDGMNESIDRLNRHLEQPQPAIVSAEQMDREWQLWQRMKNNK